MKKFTTIALVIALIGTVANAAPLLDGGDALKAVIDLETGSMTLVNTSGVPFEYNLLEIRSAAGILDPAGWRSVKSLKDVFDFGTIVAGLGGGAVGFDTFQATPIMLAEGALAAAILQPGDLGAWSLGNPIIPGSNINVDSGQGPVDFEIAYSIPSDTEFYGITNFEITGGGPTGWQGDKQDNPIMPGSQGPGQGNGPRWQFTNVDVTANNGEGLWFDPELVSAYLYETDGLSNFTKVLLPSDDDDLYIVTWGAGAGDWSVVAAGVAFDFPVPVDSFKVSGIEALVDAEDDLAFPTFLAFDENTVTFSMTGVPEPATMGLMLFGAIGMIARKRRRS